MAETLEMYTRSEAKNILADEFSGLYSSMVGVPLWNRIFGKIKHWFWMLI
jgi:hypothetical protein